VEKNLNVDRGWALTAPAGKEKLAGGEQSKVRSGGQGRKYGQRLLQKKKKQFPVLSKKAMKKGNSSRWSAKRRQFKDFYRGAEEELR